MAESAKELEQVERFGSQAMQEEWLGVMSAKAKLTLIVVRALVMIIHEILTRLTHSIDITAATSSAQAAHGSHNLVMPPSPFGSLSQAARQ
jgi:hypothetical protein